MATFLLLLQLAIVLAMIFIGAKEALETNRSVYDIVLEKGLMTQEKLDEALNPANMLASHK